MLWSFAAMALPGTLQACGWSHIDHEIGYDTSGLWSPNAYRAMLGALTIAQLGGAIWEGVEDRFGKTMWRGFEAEVIAGATASLGKIAFTRARPNQGDDPCLWFQGGSHYSFPSGEAAVAAALVTPYIIEYGKEAPAVYALAALPLWVGVGRMKAQAHWQSDLLAGWTVGGLSGWFSDSLETPITIQLLPHGAALGLKMQF